MLKQLQNRKSVPAKFLTEPAPTHEELLDMVRAALTAPDHGLLRPWKFIVIEGAARKKFGDLLAKASLTRDPSLANDKVQKQRDKPLRSPTIVTVVAAITPNNPQVPEIEQIVSAAAAAQQLMLAANALDYGAIWLTGPYTNETIVKQGLGVHDNDVIVGFIYLGTSTLKHMKRKILDPEDYLEFLD